MLSGGPGQVLPCHSVLFQLLTGMHLGKRKLKPKLNSATGEALSPTLPLTCTAQVHKRVEQERSWKLRGCKLVCVCGAPGARAHGHGERCLIGGGGWALCQSVFLPLLGSSGVELPPCASQVELL